MKDNIESPTACEVSSGAGCSAFSDQNLISWMNSQESREKHRSKYNDMQWAGQQPEGQPNYYIGDMVEFHAGGFGVISEVSNPHDGWPSSYSTRDIDGFPPHSTRKLAWHYEGDFKRLVVGSPLRSMQNQKVLAPPLGGGSEQHVVRPPEK